jgi:hypothetical protein
MTPREAGQYRRESDLAWYWQAIHFLGAPLVDHWRGLSLMRFIAVYCCVVVGQDVAVYHNRPSWTDFCILVLAGGIALGKLGYTAFLQRVTIGVGSSSTTTTTTHSEENKG